MATLDRALAALDALARWIAMALATAIIAILAAQIFFRYALNSSIIWSEEVATWCLVWVVFLGAAAIMRRWDHVQIPMLIRRLPLRARPGVIVFAKLATFVAAALVAWYGLQWVLGLGHIRSQTTGISTRWIKLAVPVGAGLMAIFALRCALEDVRRWRRGDIGYFRDYGEPAVDVVDARPAAPGS
jgi:TRAP-type C4-dicarboxylate transport system permease small subunit